MSESVTLYFTASQDSLFTLEEVQLQVFPEYEGDESGEKKTRLSGFAKTSGDSIQLLALAFARAVQYRFLKLADLPTDGKATIFMEKTPKKKRASKKKKTPEKTTGVTRFRGMLHQVSKMAPKGTSTWLRNMFSLEDDADGAGGRQRLKEWFIVSQKEPWYSVSFDFEALSPHCLHIMVNGEPVTQTVLDDIEVSLSLQTGASFPCHWESGGISTGGRLPSIRTEWYPQEEECTEASEAYRLAEQTPLLGVLGSSGSGKTTFAFQWLRRMKGTECFTQRFIFSWPFRQGLTKPYIQLPSDWFFRDLAVLLSVEFPQDCQSSEKATLLLKALIRKPTFFFLDGIDARFSSDLGERDIGLVKLIQGIAGMRGSFVLATSQSDFVTALHLPKNRVQLMWVKGLPIDQIERMAAKYQDSENEKESAGSNGNGCNPSQTLQPALQHEPETVNLCKPSVLLLEHSLVNSTKQDSLNVTELEQLNSFIRGSQGKPQLLFFYIVCVAIEPIEENELLTIAAGLPQKTGFDFGDNSKEKRDRALNKLINCRFLQKNSGSEGYFVDTTLARQVMQMLKTDFSALWTAINTSLGQHILKPYNGRPANNGKEVLELVNAAVYFCRTGDKYTAYHEIAMNMLSRGLKGYCITCLGEYQATIDLNAAILERDPAVKDQHPLQPDVPVICQHTNAMCLRFLNQLESALQQERAAWKEAKRLKTAFTMLPIGSHLLRLCHMFGLLGEAEEVEHQMLWRAGFESFRYFVPWQKRAELKREDRIDGASHIFSILALSALYRGSWLWWVKFLLNLGIKECRNNNQPVRFLLPTYGRRWHALTLLELGEWKICEQAIEARDWKYDNMTRFKQTGTFEALEAKVFLAKGLTLKGEQQRCAFEWAIRSVEDALRLARKGKYLWWEAFSSITQANILAAQGREALAETVLQKNALKLSRDHGFKLLEVDASLALSEILSKEEYSEAALASATGGLALAEQIGYGLRKEPLQNLICLLRAGRS